MSEDNRKISPRKTGQRQLNVAVDESLLDRFHQAVELRGHKKKAVIDRLVRLYVEGKVSI